MVAVITAVLAVLAGALPAAAANPEQERIAETRAQLQSVRDELDGARDSADTDQVALADADRQLQAVFDSVQAASAAVDRQQTAVDEARQRVVTAQSELDRQRELMGERIGRLYRQGRPDDLIRVLGAATATEVARQSAYINAIGREDRIQVETLTNAERRVAAEQAALGAEQEAMRDVLLEQEELLAEVEEIRNDRALIAAASDDLVARLQARESYLHEEQEQLAQEALERAAAERAAEIEAARNQVTAGTNSSTLAATGGAAPAAVGQSPDALTPVAAQAVAAQAVAAEGPAPDAVAAPVEEEAAAEPEPDPEPETQPEAEPEPEPEPVQGPAGGFSWPTSGTVTSEFGSRWGRQHAGMDIANGQGTAVAAARGGSVVDIQSGGGYGNLVIVSHGGGFTTYYAHLSSVDVSVGQSVSGGTRIGGMGCSGSCTGTHLHFEIRASGTPVNPRDYL